MSRGRKPLPETMIRHTVYLPESLSNWLTIATLDPVRSQPKYGAKTQLLTQLLKNYRKERENHENQT